MTPETNQGNWQDQLRSVVLTGDPTKYDSDGETRVVNIRCVVGAEGPSADHILKFLGTMDGILAGTTLEHSNTAPAPKSEFDNWQAYAASEDEVNIFEGAGSSRA